MAAGVYGDLLLGVTRKIPAGCVSEMWKQRMDTGLVNNLIGGVFIPSIFKRNYVGAVYGDGAGRIRAQAENGEIRAISERSDEQHGDESAFHARNTS